MQNINILCAQNLIYSLQLKYIVWFTIHLHSNLLYIVRHNALTSIDKRDSAAYKYPFHKIFNNHSEARYIASEFNNLINFVETVRIVERLKIVFSPRGESSTTLYNFNKCSDLCCVRHSGHNEKKVRNAIVRVSANAVNLNDQ